MFSKGYATLLRLQMPVRRLLVRVVLSLTVRSIYRYPNAI